MSTTHTEFKYGSYWIKVTSWASVPMNDMFRAKAEYTADAPGETRREWREASKESASDLYDRSAVEAMALQKAELYIDQIRTAKLSAL